MVTKVLGLCDIEAKQADWKGEEKNEGVDCTAFYQLR